MGAISAVSVHLRRVQFVVASVIVASMSLGNIGFIGHAVAATLPALAGGADFTALVGQPYAITDLQLTGTATDTTPVTLSVPHGTLAFGSTSGLTFHGPDNGTRIVFDGTVADVNAALSTLTYAGDRLGTQAISVSLTNADQVAYPGNGHVYEYVSGSYDWTTARTAADALSLDGVPGYLATITSSGEQDYVLPRLTGDGWIAATDAVHEGDWKWSDGPEAGLLFYQGAGNAGGAAVGANYADWNSGEPNNSGGNENCAEAYTSGAWNDLPCNFSNGYIVEYGTTGNLPNVNANPSTKTITATETGMAVAVHNCDELMALDATTGSEFDDVSLTNDIDCTGKTVVPLFSGTSFAGVFDGHGHKITHVTIDQNAYSLGLFSTTNGAVLKNVILQSGSVRGNGSIGALAGQAYNTTIENVSSDFAVTSISDSYNIGGLVGYYDTENGSSHVTNSSTTGATVGSHNAGGLIGSMYTYRATVLLQNDFATGDVSIDGATASNPNSLGGLVGDLYADDISDVTFDKTYATGVVQADMVDTQNVGGLIGNADTYAFNDTTAITIQDSYAHGDVNAPQGNHIGGLLGFGQSYSGSPSVASAITLQRTYASGAVTGLSDIGGLVGMIDDLYASETATIDDSFAAGHVIGDDTATTNGVIGYGSTNGDNAVTLNGNYYDLTRSGQAACTSTVVTGCTSIDTSGDTNHFRNNHSNAPMSNWDFTTIWRTNVGEYPTFGTTVTEDADGVPTTVESAAPNSGDANNDGTQDSQQANVTAFVDPVNNKYVALESPPACTLTQATAAAESANGTQDSGYDYPVGLLNFTAACGTNGYTATFTQYYYGVADKTFVARKYNPSSHSYMSIPNAAISRVTIAGQTVVKVVYQVTDGSSLDADGTANGTIVDPAGLAVLVVNAPNTGLQYQAAIDLSILKK